jgi:hypothetical protein
MLLQNSRRISKLVRHSILRMYRHLLNIIVSMPSDKAESVTER